jgi:hypothetical protein
MCRAGEEYRVSCASIMKKKGMYNQAKKHFYTFECE